MFNASNKPAVSFANCSIENCLVPDVVFPIPQLLKMITVWLEARVSNKVGSQLSMVKE
jgi:hypothetical protein